MLKHVTLLQKIYTIIMYILYLLKFFVYTNKFNINPEYINLLNSINIYIIAFYIIYRFNPYNNVKFNNFDKNIIFSSGLLLIFSNTFIGYYEKYLYELTRFKN